MQARAIEDVLDFVDSDVEVSEVIGVFGPYAKFVVEEIGETLTKSKMNLASVYQ